MQGADSSHDERQRILKSINNDDAKAVGRWLDAHTGDSGEVLMPNDQLNNSIMHMVAFKGRLSTLRMLWARKMKCTHRNLQGETALHWAVKCRDEAAMRAVILELVTIGDADINATTTYGDTPLLYAIADGNLAAVIELCERGASLSLLNGDGDGAIHLAISSGNLDTVAYVLGRQPDAAQVRDALGRLPIEIALQQGNEETIKMVLLAWPLCLGCRTTEGFLLHDVFPQLGLLHLVEGLGFGDECLWELALDESGEVHQFSIDVTTSGTTFFIEGFQARGAGKFEVQLNELHWEFDDVALSACFLNESGDCVMKMTANSFATHQKLLRQLDLARLSVDSYSTSLQDDPAKAFRVLSLKKAEVRAPSPSPSDSLSDVSAASGLIVRGAPSKDLAWLQKLDDKDVDLMIKWGVVTPENAKALLSKRAGSRGRDGDIFIKHSTDGNNISAGALNLSAGDTIAPPAPPPRRKAKGAAVDYSSPVPAAPPHRGARGKGGGVSFAKSDSASAAAPVPITPPPLLMPPQFVSTTGTENEEEEDVEPPPPSPPPLINHAIKCADMEAAAVLELQLALATGKVQSGFSATHYFLYHMPHIRAIQFKTC